MYHSITVGGKNTWDDWHLIPSSRPLVNPPTPKTKTIDIPGCNGEIDASLMLTGTPVFSNRTGSWEFVVDNDYMDWATIYSLIMNYLHGRQYRCVLEDDPAFYYEGSFTVNQWKSNAHRSSIVINYNLYPFKYELRNTSEDWLWDIFNFEVGIIRDYKNISVSGTTYIAVEGFAIPVSPIIAASGNGMTVSMGGASYSLYAGENSVPGIILNDGSNVLTFTGNGTVTIKYSGGSL